MSAERRAALREMTLDELTTLREELREALSKNEPEAEGYKETLTYFDEVITVITVKKLDKEKIDL
jgi:hypothetical protein